MNIAHIISQIADHKNPVICLRIQGAYPALFLSALFHHIKKSYAMRIELLDFEQLGIADMKVRLATSFLGMPTLYWVRDVSVLDAQSKKELLRYLQDYLGPNHVLFAMPVEDVSQISLTWTRLDIPEHIGSDNASKLIQQLYGIAEQKASEFYDIISMHYKELPLDTVCMLAYYIPLLGTTSLQQFLDTWLERLVAPKASLFTLSKYFFAKDARMFFPLWQRVCQHYPLQFWLVYWSEQLWRAHGFIQLHKKNKKEDAKKMAFRLPFTFVQRDWRSYSMRELKHAHAMIYGIDFALKNGCTLDPFDLFFSKFFTHQFI